MKYFYDTEFLEGTQKTWWKFGNSKPTIDLISIGIVCEDGREYYAISKDFNLKEAWDRYDEKIQHFSGDMRNQFPNGRKYKEYWIRENVLKPIFQELLYSGHKKAKLPLPKSSEKQFTYKNLKKLIQGFGKSNIQIAKELKHFIYEKEDVLYNKQELDFNSVGDVKSKIQLYGYYSAYDHVALSWIFGKMIDLPKGFPMYTRDLKQMFDEKQESRTKTISFFKETDLYDKYKENKIIFPENLKEHPQYPKQENEHNALSDAIFVKNLYHFLNKV